jgi:hypothetical protein
LETALLTDDRIRLITLLPTEYDAANTDEETVYIFDRWAPQTAPASPAIFIAQWPGTIAATATATVSDPIITEWERDHPINRHLVFTNITINEAMKIEALEGFETLITSFEDPLVAYRDDAEAPVMLIAFDTTSSDLPLRIAFPILLANAVRHMAGAGGDETWASVDIGTVLDHADAVQYVPEHDHDHGELTKVIAPGDEPETAEPAPFYRVVRAGVYEGQLDSDERVPLFTANLTDRRESNIAPAQELPVTSEQPIEFIKGGFRLGAEPWSILATLALVLSITEWFLFHRRVIE